jgi:hypothetical protein
MGKKFIALFKSCKSPTLLHGCIFLSLLKAQQLQADIAKQEREQASWLAAKILYSVMY